MMRPPAADTAGELAAERGGLATARAQGDSLWTAHYALQVLHLLKKGGDAPPITPAEAQALLAEADAAAAAAKAALPPAYLACTGVAPDPGWEEKSGFAAVRQLIEAHAQRGDATWRSDELRELARAAEARRAGPATPAQPARAQPAATP